MISKDMPVKKGRLTKLSKLVSLAVEDSELTWKAKYQRLLDSLPVAILVSTPDLQVIEWNSKAQEIFGWSAEEARIQMADFLIPPDMKNEVERILAKVIETGAPVTVLGGTLQRDGSTILCEWRNVPLHGPDGAIEALLCVAQDVSQQKLAEKALLNSERRFHSSFQSSAVGMAVCDERLIFLDVNRAFCRMVERSEKLLLGECLLNLTRAEALAPESSRLQLLKSGEIDSFSCEIALLRDRGFVDTIFSIARVENTENRQEFAICQFQDISERKQAERQLKTAHEEAERAMIFAQSANEQWQEALLEAEHIAVVLQESEYAKSTLLEAIPSLIIGLDVHGMVTQWNLAATNLLSCDAESAMGRSLKDLPLSWDVETVLAGIERCWQSSKVERIDDVKFMSAERVSGCLGVTLKPVIRSGQIDGVLLLAADTTQKRLLERQLAQAQKLESIGQLAAGIAHEINTPTQFVSDNVRYLRDSFHKLTGLLKAYHGLLGQLREHGLLSAECEELENAWKSIRGESLMRNIPDASDEALDGLKRIATIVRAMKEFSHPGNDEKALVDLNRCIESTVTVTRNEWKYIATLDMQLAPELPLVPCLAGPLSQVLLNLLVNACHAIAEVPRTDSEMGTISISTSVENEFAVIRVGDSGCGIRAEIRDRIFDPFFTTKEVGKGTGQGLALVHSVVVQQHDGRVDVESEVGKGSVFSIWLPLQVETSESSLALR